VHQDHHGDATRVFGALPGAREEIVVFLNFPMSPFRIPHLDPFSLRWRVRQRDLEHSVGVFAKVHGGGDMGKWASRGEADGQSHQVHLPDRRGPRSGAGVQTGRSDPRAPPMGINQACRAATSDRLQARWRSRRLGGDLRPDTRSGHSTSWSMWVEKTAPSCAVASTPNRHAPGSSSASATK
jgi:hypothetical protein